MVIQIDLALSFLERLGQQPAVAFHEGGVARSVQSILREILGSSGEDPTVDSYGNIIAKVPGSVPGATPMALVAHMDHPGFEAVGSQGDFVVATALGGLPNGAFAEGVPVQVILEDGRQLRGCLLYTSDAADE